ncbi:TetR/AcrR family transcriptional regulator [Zhihengliuella salsuginis]|uniref:Transcriptional regulator, TetR family protein n=1 Tax=Zhihengliuella salsuginis TaxID=578222 RepID=A0ABQ3GHC1_9MICC|nr:TetR/AcrR family transcriptional regulator [Zhihengliuella salsuginis]GHD06461.1 putative transcriptional regulator, TetR family protein [Zhihengliuella salsuginis]
MTPSSEPPQPARPGRTRRAPPPRRVGRPTTAVLTPEGITAAAIRLIEVQGAEFSMSALARSLGVAPSALYNHVSGREGLLMLVQDELMGRVDVSGFGTTGVVPALRRWAASYREVFARHEAMIPIIAVLPVTGSPRTVDMYELVATHLLDAGLPPAEALPTVVAFESLVYGSALDTNAPATIFDTSGHPRPTPGFDAALAAQAATGARAPDASFAWGLERLLAGVAAALPAS